MIEIENVGPIEHLSIPIPEGGGIVVLRGSNGDGKSHAINCVEALYSKDVRKGLRHRDGMPSGRVEGLGVTVRLGRSNTAKGELVCESLDGRVDPSQLVDPGIKDPLAADARRLATLVRLAGIKVDFPAWQSAVGEAGELIALDALVDDDPVASADRIRRKLHDVALNRERLATSKTGEANTLIQSIADVDMSNPEDSQELDRRYESAADSLSRLKQQIDDREASRSRFTECKNKLDLIAVPDLDFIQTAISGIDGDIAGNCSALDESRIAMKAAQDKLSSLTHSLDRLRVERRLADEQLGHATKQVATIEELRKVVEAGFPVPITDEAVTQAIAVKQAAREAIACEQVVRRAIDTMAKAEAAEAESVVLAKQAEKLREIARSTDSVLEQALVDAGFDSIRVYDGRLCISSDRGLEPFSDLSYGERWRHALDLAARGLPRGAVLPVCQEAFESLDPINREFVSGLARDRGQVIITAEATGGSLRAEVL